MNVPRFGTMFHITAPVRQSQACKQLLVGKLVEEGIPAKVTVDNSFSDQNEHFTVSTNTQAGQHLNLSAEDSAVYRAVFGFHDLLSQDFKVDLDYENALSSLRQGLSMMEEGQYPKGGIDLDLSQVSLKE